MSLTIKEIGQLAKLARLELSDEEKEKYSQDISSILQYVDKLQELKTDKVNLLIEAEESITREDAVIGNSTKDQKELIGLALDVEGGLIKTKAVFD